VGGERRAKEFSRCTFKSQALHGVKGRFQRKKVFGKGFASEERRPNLVSRGGFAKVRAWEPICRSPTCPKGGGKGKSAEKRGPPCEVKLKRKNTVNTCGASP